MTQLRGALVTLRPATGADVPALVAIRATPQVRERWRGDDLTAEVTGDLADPDLHLLVVELAGRIVGGIQWYAEAEPDYRHAGIDVFLDPAFHGEGIGTEAVRRVVDHLLGERGHHRITIDPAADNAAAVTAYERVGFRRVGVLRAYERDPYGDGWRDGLLMALVRPPAGVERAT